MRLAIMLSLALMAATAADGAFAQTWGRSSGTLKPSPGTFGVARPQRSGVTPISPVAPVTPRAPRARTAPEPQTFKPYKPMSVYSDRGGVNAYPSPAKPRGYVDIYGNKSNHPFAF